MRIARHVRRIESVALERQRLHARAKWIADRNGVTVGEVFDEARRLRDDAWMHGVAPEAIVAREGGRSVAEVRAEMARLIAEADGALP